jgi:RNA methyltransferase, TrmH family
MKTIKITSAANPLVRQTADIASRSKKADSGFFIAEGPHLVEAALAAASPVREIFFTPEYGQSEEGRKLLLRLSESESCPKDFIEVPDNVFLKISDAETPQGILAVAPSGLISLNELRSGRTPLLAVCDGISDPGNLGTIIRIADAAGADAVIILQGCCDPYSPKAVRATAGSVFNIPMVKAQEEEFVESMSSVGIRLVAADVRAGNSLYEADLTVPCAFVFGNESRGVSSFLLNNSDEHIRIPMAGLAESLNAAVAAAVCLFEAVRQRTKA